MITVYQIQGQLVSPLADAKLYELLSGGGIGVIVGCEITSLGGLQLRIGSGWVLIQGRWIQIEEETITVTPSSSGQVNGQLLLHMDVSNSESAGTWVTSAQTPLPSPVQEDVNGSGTIYEMQMCTYLVDQLQVTDLQTTFPVLGTAAGYIYKATFDVDSWTGSGSVSQTVPLVPVDGGPPVTSGSTLMACIGMDSTLPQATKDAMSGPASAIAGAAKTLGAGTMSVTLESAPGVDVELYFYIKQGVTPVVPPLEPVGSKRLVLLWENPNQNNQIGTTTISIPEAKNFSSFLIEYFIYYADSATLASQFFDFGKMAQLIGILNYSNVCTRTVGIDNDGSFSVGYAHINSSENSTSVCIPYKLYGML